MNNQPTIYLARAFPGRAAGLALEALRSRDPGLRGMPIVSADAAEGSEDPRAVVEAWAETIGFVESIISSGCRCIGLATSLPSEVEVRSLVAGAVAAGFKVLLVEVEGGNDPEQSNASAELLSELVATWEDVSFDGGVPLPIWHGAEAVAMLGRAQWADTYEESQAIMQELYDRYPIEASVLKLDCGPTWARFP